MAKIAIIHFTNYPKGQSRPCMAAVMRYTMQDKKTAWEDKQLVTGVNCRPKSVYDDFLRTQLLYHKDGGVRFFHMVQSFPKGELVDPVKAHAAALELAKWFGDREVLVCTHTDRDHIHSHFIVNSVNLENGKKLHIAKPELEDLRHCNDQICMKFDLPVFQPEQKQRANPVSNAEYHAAVKGESWKMRLINTIDECMKYAASREQFILLIKSEGYDVRWQDSRKNITYTTPSGMKCRDDRLHESKYLKENMEYEFTIREELIFGRIENAQQQGFDGGAGYGTTGRGNREELGSGNPTPAEYSFGARESARDSECAAEQGGRGKTLGGIDAAEPETPGAAAGNRRTIRAAGWEREREIFFRLRKSGEGHEEEPRLDGGYYAVAAHQYDEPDSTGDFRSGGECTTESDCERVLVVGAADVAGSLVRLARNLELSQNEQPASNPKSHHADGKQRSKEKQKKIALGHKADDHEEEQAWEQTM